MGRVLLDDLGHLWLYMAATLRKFCWVVDRDRIHHPWVAFLLQPKISQLSFFVFSLFNTFSKQGELVGVYGSMGRIFTCFYLPLYLFFPILHHYLFRMGTKLYQTYSMFNLGSFCYQMVYTLYWYSMDVFCL